MADSCELTFLRGEAITQREEIVGLLQRYWRHFAPQNTKAMDTRIANSNGHIVAAYLDAHLAGVLEALGLDTAGNAYELPDTFNALTGRGTWSTHRDEGDSVVLVDLTVPREYQGRGIARGMIHYALENFDGHHTFTYSPFGSVAPKMHGRQGAMPARRIPHARPGLPQPDVMVMQYR